MWDVRFHARDNNLRYAFGAKRSDKEALLNPWTIRIVLPQVIPLSRAIIPEASRLRWILRQHWDDRTRY